MHLLLVVCGILLAAATVDAPTASLRVIWSGSAGAGTEKLSLLPVDVTLPALLTREEAVRLWTRAIGGNEQCWDSLPAGTYQVILRADSTQEGVPPRDLGEVVLAPGEERTVRIVLPPRLPRTAEQSAGATVAMRVRSAVDAQPQSGVRVTAVRAHELEAQRGDFGIERLAIATTVTDDAGWARLTELPEERVVFAFEAPERRYPRISEPYALPAGEETIVDDLLLERAANVQLSVSLPQNVRDVLELSGVELVATGHTHWPSRVPLRGTLTPDGGIIEDVPPGHWTVRATGRLKNGFVLSVADANLNVVAGASQHVRLVLQDRLYRGSVTRGGRPISGVINLKPADRRSGRRSAIAPIAPDGTFYVLLEAPGEYSATIQESTGSGVRLSRYLTFDDPDDEVEAEVPTGRIEGVVMDAEGRSVAEAVITATQQIAEPAGSSFVRNRGDGRFVLESVGTGTWEVVAETAQGRSEATIVALGRDGVEGVTLLLDPTRTIALQVTDGTGVPLRGAFVTAEFPRPGGLPPHVDVRRTGDDGTATLRLTRAQQATPVNLVVAAPDLRLTCALRRLDSAQTIRVPAVSGEVRLLGRDWGAMRGVQGWLVSSGGCALPFIGTHIVQEPGGARAVVFPRLAPGSWTYVETRNVDEVAALMTGRAAMLPRIQQFNVDAGRTTRVSLPR